MNLAQIRSAARIAARNLARQRGRTALTLAAIVFGVVALVLSGGFVEDTLLQLRETTIRTRLGHVQVFRAGYDQGVNRDSFKFLIDDPQAILDVVSGDRRVVSASTRISFSGLLNNGRSDLPIVAEGVEPDKERVYDTNVELIAGAPLDGRSNYETLIGEGVARSLDIKVGDFCTLVANTPGGALNTVELKVTGIFRTFSADFDNRAVRLSMAAAKDLLRINAVGSVVILLKDTDSTGAMASQLDTALSGKGYVVKTWLQLDDFYPKTVALYQRQFGILQLIILVIVMLGVSNSVNMTAFERQGEYGTVRALGVTSGSVLRMVLLENLLLGVVGAVAGVILAALAAWTISLFGIPMPPPPNANSGYIARILLVPSVMVTAAAVGVAATVGSSIVGALAVARMPIVDALRRAI
jgi:putative ABC transport system permease protein